MRPADDRLERIIAEITSALRDTSDPRFAQLQRQALGLRSADQVAHLEQAQGIAPRVALGRRSQGHG